jgi:acyl dehydratase
VQPTTGRTLTETDVVAFAGLSGDFTELHTNEEFARATPFGRRVAHGALVFSIAVGLTTRTNIVDDTIVALSRVDHLRFARPVFIGDTIHVEKCVVSNTPTAPDRALVSFDTRVINQRGETVVAYVDRLVVKRRQPPARDVNVEGDVEGQADGAGGGDRVPPPVLAGIPTAADLSKS